jgi:hypothetical protein
MRPTGVYVIFICKGALAINEREREREMYRHYLSGNLSRVVLTVAFPTGGREITLIQMHTRAACAHEFTRMRAEATEAAEDAIVSSAVMPLRLACRLYSAHTWKFVRAHTPRANIRLYTRVRCDAFRRG